MRWIALTGVNGFIGHNLLLSILEKQGQPLVPKVDWVLGTDLARSVGRSNHHRTHDKANYEFVCARQFLRELRYHENEWEGPPIAVIHNGACSSTTETDPEVFKRLNIESSQELFKYCAKKEIPFIYASSASVYGNGELGFSDATDVNDGYSPMNLYGKSKHHFDSWALKQEVAPPVWYGLRYFNVFGAFEAHKKAQASVFHWGTKQIEKKKKLKLFKSTDPDIKNGEQKRDFVSVDDITRVTFSLLGRALRQREPEGRFINVGRGVAATWLEVGRALFGALGVEPDFEFIPMPQELRKHYQNFTQADLTTLHELGVKSPFLELQPAFEAAFKKEEDYGVRDALARFEI